MAILENNNSIDEKIALNHGLQTLRSSNRFLLNPIGKSELDLQSDFFEENHLY